MYIYNFFIPIIVIVNLRGVGILRGSIIGDFPLYICMYLIVEVVGDILGTQDQ